MAATHGDTPSSIGTTIIFSIAVILSLFCDFSFMMMNTGNNEIIEPVGVASPFSHVAVAFTTGQLLDVFVNG